ncbi:MAG: hypothetical protein WA418_24595 [Bradyrhizobium sp.]
MIDRNKINQIAKEVAAAHLSSENIVDAISEPTTDSEGRDALRITIVIKPGVVQRFAGDAVLDTLVQIQDRLREAGEERFPIIEYATEDELQESGDP